MSTKKDDEKAEKPKFQRTTVVDPEKKPEFDDGLPADVGAGEENRLLRECYRAGWKARLAGKSLLDVPAYPVGAFDDRWREGFHAAKQTPQVPVLEAPKPGAKKPENPAHFWPRGTPLPVDYSVRRPPVPCPKCKRLCLPDATRAVKFVKTKDGCAFFSSRCCGVKFKLGLKK